jgi:hypothetical protein
MICNESCRKPYEDQLCLCSCIPSSAPYKKDDDTLDREERIRRGIPIYTEGGPKYTNLIDDGRSIGLWERPIRVGQSILLCGRRNDKWPRQWMVGPDWPCTVIVYVLVVLAHGIVLPLAAPCLGWPVLGLGLFGFFFLMYIYSAVACTNPGMVLQRVPDSYTPFITASADSLPLPPGSEHELIEGGHGGRDVESGLRAREEDSESEDSGAGASDNKQLLRLQEQEQAAGGAGGLGELAPPPYPDENTINAMGANVNTRNEVPCGHCGFDRSSRARHCQYCGCCIEGLDHHCPWSGGCSFVCAFCQVMSCHVMNSLCDVATCMT